MAIDMELYRIFYSVATLGSISRAAETLFISQPGVSKSIQRLERSLGVKLFNRSSRGVTLTTEGDVFFDYVYRAMNTIVSGEKMLRRLKTLEDGSLTLGVSTTLCKHFLIPRLKGFCRRYPDLKIQIINKTTLENLDLLKAGRVDLCIVSKPFRMEDYRFIKLMNVHDIFVAGQGYLDTCRLSENHEIFKKGRFMLLENNNITRQYINKYFAETGVVIQPEIEISDMDILIELAGIGMGITCVVREFVEEELAGKMLVEILADLPIPERSIGIVFHKNVSPSLAAKAFIKYLDA